MLSKVDRRHWSESPLKAQQQKSFVGFRRACQPDYRARRRFTIDDHPQCSLQRLSHLDPGRILPGGGCLEGAGEPGGAKTCPIEVTCVIDMRVILEIAPAHRKPRRVLPPLGGGECGQPEGLIPSWHPL
jgi:hypothetical protein